MMEYVMFNNKQHPEKLSKEHIENLAVKRRVSASTQNQALCAIVYLYKKKRFRMAGRCSMGT
ncbi:MAG: phage integrase N-terminal SAM-like domain-containing protein [Ignavibacteria bacterium]|jgi:hypothetical protein